LPLFFTKKEAFEWLKTGKKTIEIRRGKSRQGEFAVFQAGQNILRLKIISRQTGILSELIRSENYRLVIPSALRVGDALFYFREIYGSYDGIFTAYYVEPAISTKNQIG